MNIKQQKVKIDIGNNKTLEVKPLPPKVAEELDVDLLEKLYKVKSMQYRLSDNTILARFGVDINSPIALNYHFNKTIDFDSFIKSLEDFMSLANKKLKNVDKEKLKDEYEKHFLRVTHADKSISQQLVQQFIG